MDSPSFQDILSARARIAPWTHVTPVLCSRFFDQALDAQVFFKAENFQKAGSFKARGAVNAVFSLAGEARGSGVATHSSGNHGSALAYAAQARNMPCHVVMPENAPSAKNKAVRGYGGIITQCVASMSAREAALADVQQHTGAEFIHPYDDPRVIAGQGTCACELMEQVDGLDAVIAPVGGGGLISGSAIALNALDPTVTVYGAEPAQADDAARSLRAGHLIVDDAPQTIADGLKMSLKPRTFECIQRYVDDIFTVDEQAIIDAMRMVWERMKIIIEPSCAVPVAALLANPGLFAGKRVGVIITGGNVDLDRLPWALG